MGVALHLKRIKYWVALKLFSLESKFKGKPIIVQDLLQKVDNNKICLIHKLDWDKDFIEYQMPKSLSGDTDDFFIQRQRIPLFPQYLLKIRNAKIATRSGLLILADGSFSSEHIHQHNFYIEQSRDYFGYTLRRTTFLRGACYSLIGYCPGEHYHMLSDFTQRLYRILELLPDNVIFLLPDNTTNAAKEAFRHLGISPHRMMVVDRAKDIVLQELYWSPATHYSGYELPEAVSFVSDTILNNISKIRERNNHFIYITRKGNRKVSNEKELFELLSPYGFCKYELSEMDFEDQVLLFTEAKIVISPHGAGLVNIMFCKAGTHVLEFLPDPILSGGTCYWSISVCKGLRYSYVKCATSIPDVDRADLVVPIGQVKKYLEGLL